MQTSLRSRIFRLVPIVCTAALLVAIPAGYADHKGKPHGKGGPDRIPGCVTFAAGNAVTDDDPLADAVYCDGDPTKNSNGDDDSMQVAMNCEFNHFNVNPGGGIDAGGRYLSVSIDAPGFKTGITSCPDKNSPIDVYFVDVEMNNGAGCPFNFNQQLRSSPTATNVCDLTAGQDIDVDIRFQNNIHHQSICRGGKGKCGNKIEAFEIFYGTDDVLCPQANIKCDAVDDGSCNQWTITAVDSDGPAGPRGGCVVNGNGTAQESYSLPFTATFTPL